MKKLILLLSGLLAFNAFAEVDTKDLAPADEAVEMTKIDLEGQYSEAAPAAEKVVEKKIAVKQKRQLSPSERLRLRRARLELQNKIMVERKIEQIRMQQELALAKKLEDSMNKTIQAIEIK